ncbi:MAG: ribosome biogenesis GTPase YlqF [Clostridia bacterium]
MKINWFPGHMTKALRMMEKELAIVDAIVYVLDARAPKSCISPEFNRLFANKQIIYVLSKIDLADDFQTALWQKKLDAITFDCTFSGAGKKLISELKNYYSKRREKFLRKGLQIGIRAMVVGVPNCGKSTLINNLAGKAKTVTGDRPGVTKGKQMLKIASNIELLDTPGTLWQNLEDEEVAKNLAFIGSIKAEVLDETEVALEFIKVINKLYPNVISQRYKIKTENKTQLDIFEEITLARHFLLSKNELDYNRSAKCILDDFRKGKFGKITLDQL